MRTIILPIVVALLWAAQAQSQIPGQRPEVGRISFVGNEELSTEQFLSVIQTRETPGAVWKWIYHRFNKEILGGQKPEYFDPVTFSSDYQQMKLYYTDNGFFHSKVDTAMLFSSDKVALTFNITEGNRSFIDTILYFGLESLPSDIQEELFGNKQIKAGDPYILNKVEAEFRRIVGALANNGYVNVKVVSSEARHYASTDNFSIIFIFDPGKRYSFGQISVAQDTSTSRMIDPAIVLRHLDFSAGEYYSEAKKIESERNLNRLGIFEATKIENVIPEMSSDRTQIPVRILVRTRSFQELTPEIGVNDENNAFNVLFGIGYGHRNFFGGARNFSTRLRFNLQSLQFQSLFKGNALHDSSLVSKVDLTVQLIQPYFFNNKTSISFALSAMLDKQATYYIPSLSSRIGTQSQTATYTKLFVDWNLQLSDPKNIGTQQDSSFIKLVKSLGFEKQFNSFLTITLQRDKRNDIFYPSEGIFQSISVEEGGFFPRVFGGTLGVDLPYSQYAKLTVDGQWYWDPAATRNYIWATRWRAGAALLYGDSPLKDIPLSQKYFSGGSGSVRGWAARGLGMVPEKDQGGDAFFEGNIEGRWNLLKGAGTLWFLDLEKISLVFFYDCGNVWAGPEKIRVSEIAMAFGFGIRYNTIAGPIRIDFGMKLYDPDGQRWVTEKRFFPETFTQGVLHLGVGHTF